MKTLASTLIDELEKEKQIILVTVWEQDGSAPRGTGARMVVRPDGSIWGTVGGGRFEAEAIQNAVKLLRSGSEYGVKLHYALAGSTDRDMICGGSLTLLLEPLSQTLETMAMLQDAAWSEQDNAPYIFAVKSTESSVAEDKVLQVERFVIHMDKSGEVEGQRALAEFSACPHAADFSFSSLRAGIPLLFKCGQSEYVFELMGAAHTLHIFGAGHVAKAVAAIAVTVGFRYIVIDDRSEFANSSRFPDAAGIEVPAHMTDYMRGRKLDLKDGVVILTRGHAHDQEILEQCAECGAGYVGMIGSKTKKKQVYANLLDKGIKQGSLDRVYSPIGLAINAETPEEIAVSIVGELIAWRNAKQ